MKKRLLTQTKPLKTAQSTSSSALKQTDMKDPLEDILIGFQNLHSFYLSCLDVAIKLPYAFGRTSRGRINFCNIYSSRDLTFCILDQCHILILNPKEVSQLLCFILFRWEFYCLESLKAGVNSHITELKGEVFAQQALDVISTLENMIQDASVFIKYLVCDWSSDAKKEDRAFFIMNDLFSEQNLSKMFQRPIDDKMRIFLETLQELIQIQVRKLQ